MKESIGIVYDGVEMLEENGVQINDNGGLFSETFVAPKRIIEERIRGKDEPYFYGVERDPISFTLSFFFDEKLSDERKREIARILDQDYYKPIYAVNNPHRIYYAMCVDDSTHIHNGIEMGYVTLNFRTNSPYAFSPIYSKNFDFSSNTPDGSEIVFVNDGDIPIQPLLEIRMLEDGDLRILNFSNGGKEFEFKDLEKDEILFVDCHNEHIESNVDFRFDNFNDEYLSFVRGNNYLKVYGKCFINMKYQFKFK